MLMTLEEKSRLIYTHWERRLKDLLYYMPMWRIYMLLMWKQYILGDHIHPKRTLKGHSLAIYLLEQACSCGYELIKRRAICRKGDQGFSMSWLVLLLAWITTQLEIYITSPGSSPHLTDNICVQSYNHVVTMKLCCKLRISHYWWCTLRNPVEHCQCFNASIAQESLDSKCRFNLRKLNSCISRCQAFLC
jgi:hypothetical protein